MSGSSKRSEPHWLNRFELILLAVTGSTVLVVTVLDFVGVLDQISWLAARVPTLTLLLIGSVSTFLVIERRRYLEEIHRSTEQRLDRLTEHVINSAVLQPLGTRHEIADIYRQSFASASRSVDIIALTAELALRAYETAGFREKLLDEQCDIRILILDPDSPLWDYRSKDQGTSRKLPGQKVRWTRQFLQRLEQDLDLGRCRGSLKVRLHNHIPYFAYFRADDTMILGLYYAFTVGGRSHDIKVAKGTDVFHALENHFEAIWHREENQEIAYIGRWSDPALRVSGAPPSDNLGESDARSE